MKKLLLLIIVFFVSLYAFCAKPPTGIEIEKEGGVRKILTFWKVTYNSVSFEKCPKCQNSFGKITCKGEGINTCKISVSSNGSGDNPIEIGEHMYSAELIYKVCDEISDLVDQSIYDGNSEGSAAKKISAKSIDGNEMILAFTTSWKNADVKTGDVKYTINISELELK